ncbi:uncharacterized protein C15orf39 homolog [Engraulis encrasicolus]|uniref:uncharacterized protein C15orf39 homolog n=1 Tax=Engraulis encrasicolus TaxID=184585 RepID=UPI002FD0EAC6
MYVPCLGNASRSPLVATALAEGTISSPGTAYPHHQDKAKVPLPVGAGPAPGPVGVSLPSPLSVKQLLLDKRRQAAYYATERERARCGGGGPGTGSGTGSPKVLTPVAVRHQLLVGVGANRSCPQALSPMRLAVPKPMYGHTSSSSSSGSTVCCSDARCTAGRCYGTEPPPPGIMRRTPTHLYEEEWLMGYRKDLEMVTELRSLYPELVAKDPSPGKEATAEEYCGMDGKDAHLKRRASPYGEITHSNGYACSSPGGATFISVPPEPCQRLQFPSTRDYPGFLPAAHPRLYGPHAELVQCGVPRKVYPGYSYLPKYLHVPRHVRAYYSQSHVEAEKACAIARDVYSNASPSSPSPTASPAHCSPSPLFRPALTSTPGPGPSPIPNPTTPSHLRLPRHHLPLRGVVPPHHHQHGFRPYHPRFNAGHPKPASVRPAPLPYGHLLHQTAEKPLDYSLSGVRPPWGPGQVPFPYRLPEVGQSPSRPIRFRPELRSPQGKGNIPPQAIAPLGHTMDFNGECGVTDKVLSAVTPEKRAHRRDSAGQSSRKRSLDTRDGYKKEDVTVVDDDDVFEVEVTNKKRKVDLDSLKGEASSPHPKVSPPMPVINQVFSLAPYKLYLEAAGVLLPSAKRTRSNDGGTQQSASPSPKVKYSPERNPNQKSKRCHSLDSRSKRADVVSVKPQSVDFPKKKEETEEASPDRKFKRELELALASSNVIELKFPSDTLERKVKSCSETAVASAPMYKVEGTSEHGTESTNNRERPKNTPNASAHLFNIAPAPSVVVAPVALPAKKQEMQPAPLQNPVRVQNLQNIPPQCLKLTTYNIVLPDILRKPVPILNQSTNPSLQLQNLKPNAHIPNPNPNAHLQNSEVLCKTIPILNQNTSPNQSPNSNPYLQNLNPNPHLQKPPMLLATPLSSTEQQTNTQAATAEASQSRQARHQFMEMHQALCKLLYTSASEESPQVLRDWLCSMELTKTTFPPDKHQRVACLVGARAREVWTRARDLHLLLQRLLAMLKGYHARSTCPFPHVTRAGGGIFVPMLVLKEGLFPQVQGTHIDQVLQEHRVELRPTTLSEEKLLTQVQRRSFSSKLRRLLSLRHLPEVYADVLNLFYYTCVCKVLDSVSHCADKKTPQGFNRRFCSSADVATDVPVISDVEGLSAEPDVFGNSPYYCCSAGSTEDPTNTTSSRLGEPERNRFTVKEVPERNRVTVKEEPERNRFTVKEEPERNRFTVKEEPERNRVTVKEEPERNRVTVKEEPEEWDANALTCRFGTEAGECHLTPREEPENVGKLDNMEVSKNLVVKLENVEVSKNSVVKLENVNMSEDMEVKLEKMDVPEDVEVKLEENMDEPEEMGVKLEEDMDGWGRPGEEEQEEEPEWMQEPERWTIVNSVAGGEEEVVWELVLGLYTADNHYEKGQDIKVEVVNGEDQRTEEEEQKEEEREVVEEQEEEEEVVNEKERSEDMEVGKEKERTEEEEEVESLWCCPVSSDEVSSEQSGPDTDSVYAPSRRTSSSSSSSSSSPSRKTQEPPRGRPGGVVLKLRKVSNSGGGPGTETLYQAVSNLTEPSEEGRSKGEDGKGRHRHHHHHGTKRWKRIRSKTPQKHNKDRTTKEHKRDRRDKGRQRERERERRRRERKKRRKERNRSRKRERRERRRKRLRRARILSSSSPSSEDDDQSTPGRSLRDRAFHGRSSHVQSSHDRSSPYRRAKAPKIRYCPYLSTCHRSDHRRRWVLRSAVQSARRVMQQNHNHSDDHHSPSLGPGLGPGPVPSPSPSPSPGPNPVPNPGPGPSPSPPLPDLVGKRIRHLYEEKDKSEVWYRGTVLRVHESHPNPLKTVFEVHYDSEPEWQYYLELLLDYQKGWLKLEHF